MRGVWIPGLAALAIGGCSGVQDNGSPIANMINMTTDVVNPGARDARKAGVDDAKCRSYGYQTGTDGYASCRLELERLRAGSAPIRVHVN